MEEAVSSLGGGIGWCPVPFVLVDILAVAEEFARHVMFTAFVFIHHVTAVKDLVAQLECLVVGLAVEAFLLFCFSCVLGHTTRSVGARKCINVRGEGYIQRVSLFPSDVIIFFRLLLDLFPRLDAVETFCWAR